jgi:DNA mismatch repair protein MutL
MPVQSAEAPDTGERQPLRESAPLPPESSCPFRILGEALETYIVVEKPGGLLLIDKHAAHERILFDRLVKEPGSVMAQVLLSPAVVALPKEESAVLLENRGMLSEFGFEVEDFGGGSLIVRQTPWDIDPGGIPSALSELAGCILDAKRVDPKSVRGEVLSSIACKAAVKAGSKSSPEEMTALVEEVMAGRVRYCPHGRPVAISLSRAQLEKQFGRIQ